jgi:hypothetical protein
MEAPTAEQIARLKQQHADRALHLVELQQPGEEEIYYVVMGGANEDEYKKFSDDVMLARESTKESERNEKMRFAGKNAVLRQAVWPDREAVKDLLFRNPTFVTHLAEKIHDHAGSTAEVRSKKL